MKDTMINKYILIVFVACGTLHGIVNSQSPNSEQCQSILKAASSSVEPACQPIGDCTGLSCSSTQLDRTVVASVNKCTDPLEVNVTVYVDSKLVLARTVSGTGEIAEGNYVVDVSVLERDDLTATIMLMSVVDGVKYTAVPSVQIPLNASDCMCESVKNAIAGENEEELLGETCMANAECTGQKCSINFASIMFLLEIDSRPCANPPGFVFITSANGTVLSENYFNKDTNISVLGLGVFAFTLEHREYSVIMEGKLILGGETYNLFHKMHLILDKSMCVSPSKTNTHSATGTPVPSQVIVSPRTCDALKGIRDQTNTGGSLSTCSVNNQCDTLKCVVLDEYTVSFQPNPCLDPPGIHVIINEGNEEIYNEVITETTKIPVGDFFSLTVNLKLEDDGFVMKVNGEIGSIGTEFPVIPETFIPIDRCYCRDATCTASETMTGGTIKPTNSRDAVAADQSSNNTALIVVPTVFGVLLFIALIVVVIIAVILLMVVKMKTLNVRQRQDEMAFEGINKYSKNKEDEHDVTEVTNPYYD